MNLRPYQTDAINAIRTALEQHQSTLAVMPTGSGKTQCFASLIGEYIQRGRSLVVAHRAELIYQAVDRIREMLGPVAEIEMADARADMSGLWRSPVIVSSVQTQVAGCNGYRRYKRFDPAEFVFLVVDEAHHAVATSYRAVMDHYKANPRLKILGVTATPDRQDEKALGLIFDSVAYEYDLWDAIQDGWLVEPNEGRADVSIDLSHCRSRDGDLNGADLAREMTFEKPCQEVAQAILDLCGYKQTLVFAASVEHVIRLTEILERHKPGSAVYLTDKVPKDERAERLAAFCRNERQYLVNFGICGEGFDIPGIECVVQARPTKSRALYAQQIGRGTRALPGVVDGLDTNEQRRRAIAESAKPELLVIDIVGNSGKHKLATCADVLGGRYDDDVTELATRIARGSTRPMSTMDALRQAEQQRRLERQQEDARKREFLKARGTTRFTKTNPFDILDIRPHRVPAWHEGRPPSVKQRALLEKFRIEEKDLERLTFTGASQLIGKLIERRKAGLCTYRQAKMLRKYQYDPTEVTFVHAGEIMTKLAANKWRPLK